LEFGIWLLEFERSLTKPMVSIRKELAEHNIIPRKRWGQHFLVDRNILSKVVRTAGIVETDVVLEVGPGLGILTLALAKEAKRIIAVEIDKKLVEIIQEKIADCPNVEIIRKDIMEVDFNDLIERGGQPLKVVANLPYQISTPLLFRFIESRSVFASLTLMLQKEVAERMAATPGGKDYGPLSIFTQIVSDFSIQFLIKPSAFFPPPKVDSALIHVVWKKRPWAGVEDIGWFRRVVKGSFGYRRKTLMNALRYSGLSLPEEGVERMKRIGIDPQRRPETLTIQEFIRLAEVLKP
jgi:16S rRNA (adenine1518-N6/adenine1519-N6)-dimethyltransferase